MGDPRKPKKQYSTPSHPWQRARIEEEKVLVKDYGLKNKKEVWRMTSLLKNFTQQAKNLAGGTGEQVEKEKVQLLKRLKRLGLAGEDITLSGVLNLSPKDIMERRLQNIVYKKGFARSQKQARQFIVHGHILISGKKMTVPSYIVTADDEKSIVFDQDSSLSSDDHPERVILQKKAPKRQPRPVDQRMGRGRQKRRGERR